MPHYFAGRGAAAGPAGPGPAYMHGIALQLVRRAAVLMFGKQACCLPWQDGPATRECGRVMLKSKGEEFGVQMPLRIELVLDVQEQDVWDLTHAYNSS